MTPTRDEATRKLHRALWLGNVITETPQPKPRAYGHRQMIVVVPRKRGEG